MHITDDVLNEFKQRMNIYHSHKDEALKSLLEHSHVFLANKCGAFPMDEPNQGKELVFERARYAYHDSVEHFDQNFMSMVMNFSLSNLKEADADDHSEQEV